MSSEHNLEQNLKKLITFGFLTIISAFITQPGWAAGNPVHGKKLYSICVACHGATGKGLKIVNAPRISGQHEWYVAKQLKNYRDGVRGIHIDDITGMQMRSIAITLKTDKEIADVAAYVATLKSDSPATTMNGNILSGKKAYGTCVACHGQDGMGNKTLNAPVISGLQDWYLARQLSYFKKGVRGRIQKDLTGQQMRPMAMNLEDAEIKDLAVYVASLERTQTTTDTGGFSVASNSILVAANISAGDSIRGKELYSICVACHGTNGEGKKITNAPRISGQQSWYVRRQLKNYRDGIRGVHIDDITGMQMRSIAMMLKTDQEIADVAAYLATLKTSDPEHTLNGDIEAGRKAFATCVACHGTDGTGNKELNAPSISGLQDWYVSRQLGYFKKGVRGRIQRDTTGLQMRPMAIPLDDATINNLAVYIATLNETTALNRTYQASQDSSTASMSARMSSAKPGILESSEPLYLTCTACHGTNGEGKIWLGAPRLSGQNGWYLERQLANWKKGTRGTHPGDVYGMQMRPMSMTLADDAAVKKVVAYIGTLESPKPQTTVQGDLQAGQGLYGTCTACHGPAGMGNQALNAPKIAGLPDWYVVKQLKGFKEGYRGKHPRDVYGQQMRPMALALADDQAIYDVSAYIASFDESATAPPAAAKVESTVQPTTATESEPQKAVATTVEASAEKGKTLYTTCVACHGADGAGNQALNAPRIAGQSDWYLTRQLNGFKAGYRGSNPEDLYGQQMRPMSMILADDQSVADVVAYIRTLKGSFSPAALSGDAEAGKGSYATCVACHGPDAQGNKALNAPNLSGLQDWYLSRQLKNFKKGIRGAHSEDTFGQQMRPMSMTLVDDNTINNVVAYILSLRK